MPVKILAHGDTDGICAAAIIKTRVPDVEIWFTRPVNLLRDLNSIEQGTTIFIVDVAISETDKENIFTRMRELAKSSDMVYIDHHPLPYNTLKKDIPATQIAHELGTSASELAFRLLIGDEKSDLDRIAIWGAIADYCENTPFVQEGLNKYDRRTIYLEAGLLSQALGEAGGDYAFKREVVNALAKGVPPSEIPDLVDKALKATAREWEVYEYVKKNVVVDGNLAILLDLPSGSLGKAALYALGITGADIGICTRRDDDEIDISIRKRASVRIDLNELLRHITARLGGSGGGHEAAAGATVPAAIFETFLETFKREVAPIIKLSKI
ncbi:MAG: DHH family phosphoesterase [Candidatus Hadarchaeales archaeon]